MNMMQSLAAAAEAVMHPIEAARKALRTASPGMLRIVQTDARDHEETKWGEYLNAEAVAAELDHMLPCQRIEMAVYDDRGKRFDPVPQPC